MTSSARMPREEQNYKPSSGGQTIVTKKKTKKIPIIIFDLTCRPTMIRPYLGYIPLINILYKIKVVNKVMEAYILSM